VFCYFPVFDPEHVEPERLVMLTVVARPRIPPPNCYLEREIGNHLASGISKSHACAIAIGLLGRVSSGHE
jgi:hypothetical protein